jgi:hypothetical protein
MDAYLRKCQLRSELAVVSAELDAGVQSLSAVEIAELQSLMAAEVTAADHDANVLRAEVAKEAELAKTVKPVMVRIPRRAAHALAMEAERRIACGSYPSSETLVSEAVCAQYEARP